MKLIVPARRGDRQAAGGCRSGPRALEQSFSRASRGLCLMRLACLVLLLVSLPGRAGEGKRYGVTRDAKSYPQASAKEALASVLKAIRDRKFDYLVAHLADPAFVDDRVKRI